MKPTIKFSVISPVYGAATILPELINRITIVLAKITDNYEVILVEDNSPDNSWEIIKQLSKMNDHIIGLHLSRNFGQQNALNAGFDFATGDYIVTLDCDLQDEPENIILLYNKALEGYDVVFAGRLERQDSFLKIAASKLFYQILGYLTETEQDYSIANFTLYNKKAVEAMSKIGDYQRYYPMLNRWIGYRTIKIPVKHAARKDQKTSSYSFKKRIKLAFNTIIAFSDKPLRLVLKFGILLVLSSLVLAMTLVIRYFVLGQNVSGWLSVFLSIWLLAGIMIIILGLIGIYLGKIFEKVKGRPTYLVSEQTSRKQE